MLSRFMLKYLPWLISAQEFSVIKPHVSVDRFVYFKTMHHVNLDEIKHCLDFKGPFPLMIEKYNLIVLVWNLFYFFAFMYN